MKITAWSAGSGDKVLPKRGKYLLQRTVNVGDPKSKTNQQAAIGTCIHVHIIEFISI